MWKEDLSRPKEDWCDYDYMASYIHSVGYVPKTTMKNLITMIFLYYDNVLENIRRGYYAVEDTRVGKDRLMINIPDVATYVEENGGLKDFDYWA